jgi:hypothetical protein
MALVEVTRFLDLTEAQVAASALHASGIEAEVVDEVLGRNAFALQLAMGGFRLMVDEADAAAARALVEDCRAEPSAIAPLPPREAAARTLLSLALTLLTGVAAPLRPRRPSRLVDPPHIS